MIVIYFVNKSDMASSFDNTRDLYKHAPINRPAYCLGKTCTINDTEVMPFGMRSYFRRMVSDLFFFFT